MNAELLSTLPKVSFSEQPLERKANTDNCLGQVWRASLCLLVTKHFKKGMLGNERFTLSSGCPNP